MIAIVDYGSQFTGLIAKKLPSETFSPDDFLALIQKKALQDITGVIVSGSPRSVGEADLQWAQTVYPILMERNIPTLGICFGLQQMAKLFGSQLLDGEHREYGKTENHLSEKGAGHALFKNVPEKSIVWMSHGNTPTYSPDLEVLSSSNQTMTSFQVKNKNLYAVLFHPEVTHTEYGEEVLRNFALLCHGQVVGESSWESFLRTQEKALREIPEIMCAVSGGVDSTVVAVLLSKYTNVHAIYVDHGLQRDYDLSDLKNVFQNYPSIKLHVLEERERFLGALTGVRDPEEKRKIIGRSFIEAFAPFAKDLGVKHFAQGTIASDVIESGKNSSGTAQKIKSHHNVGALPEHLPFELVEPVRALYKDEVRSLGRYLGISETFLRRHPFPGPGLAIRCLGEIHDQRIGILRAADKIFHEELRRRGLYEKTWQAGVILLPIRSTGVMGDGSSFEECLAIRMVDSVDAMTAEATEVPWKDLKEITNRIINEVKGINRIVYDVTSKPPATIEWE